MNRLTNLFGRRTLAAPPQDTARPRLEELESRDVPSYLAAAFPGHGVWGWTPQTGGWQQLTAANASLVAAASDYEVVGEFPGQGVWLYSGGAWRQLTANNASGLGIAGYFNSDTIRWTTYVVAEFPGQGLWRFSITFNQLAPVSAAWQQLTANNATLQAVDSRGGVAAEFPGWGVWRFADGAGWRQLTGNDATCLALGLGYTTFVAAEFPGWGVWRYADNAGWQQLTPGNATALAVDNNYGTVVATFPSSGVWSYGESYGYLNPGWGPGWNHLTGADAAFVGFDANGGVYGQFNGSGLWYEPQARGWTYLIAEDAVSIGVGW
jgi:hypothetical protein